MVEARLVKCEERTNTNTNIFCILYTVDKRFCGGRFQKLNFHSPSRRTILRLRLPYCVRGQVHPRLEISVYEKLLSNRGYYRRHLLPELSRATVAAPTTSKGQRILSGTGTGKGVVGMKACDDGAKLMRGITRCSCRKRDMPLLKVMVILPRRKRGVEERGTEDISRVR